MNKRQSLALTTHLRTLTFLNANHLRIGPLEGLAVEMDECLARLKGIVASQSYRKKQREKLVSEAARLRRVVRLQMLRIKRWSPRLLKGIAGVTATRHVPHATKRTAVIIEAADAMLKALKPYASFFIRSHFPADFHKKLRADTRALERCVKLIAAEKSAISRDAAAAPRLLRDAREIERAMDGTIAVLAADGNKRAISWQAAHRMGDVRGRHRLTLAQKKANKIKRAEEKKRKEEQERQQREQAQDGGQ